jgi:hypothetical protein
MPDFNWHSGTITRDTIITPTYRNTQKVRRFFKAECGPDFKFNRDFMAWLKQNTGNTLGQAAQEWTRRKQEEK